jgi:thioredoxin-like negative regulator of GroEL
MGFHYAHKPPGAGPSWLADQVGAGGAILVEFAQRDAPTCRLEEPIMAKVLKRYANRLRVVQSDVDASPEDAAAFAVSAVPTFVLFVDGVEKDRLVGYQSVDDLTRALEEGAVPPPD